MTTVRYLVALLCNCLGFYLLVDLVLEGFSLFVLALAVLALALGHFAKPPLPTIRAGQDWLDILDLLTDLPYTTLMALLRALRLADRAAD